MKITLNANEFEEVRKILISLNEDELTTEFNKIFEVGGNHGVIGNKIVRTNAKYIEIPEHLVLPILKAVTKNGGTIKELAHANVSVSMLTLGKDLSKIKQLADKLNGVFRDLRTAFKSAFHLK